MSGLTLESEEVFGHLCQKNAMFFYMFRDFIPYIHDEFEVGIVSADDNDTFIVEWQVIYSTSGCDGMNWSDTYRRGQLPDGRWKMLHGKNGMVDALNTKNTMSQLCWSSMPVNI